jgi:acetyl esterase/lipase
LPQAKGKMLNTLELVDPGLRQILALFTRPTLTTGSLPEARSRTLPITAVDESGIHSSSFEVPSRSGAPDVPIRIYRPAHAACSPCIFHMHGGGFVLGSAKEMAPIHFALVRELGCAIVTVDYRLAPETEFPGSIEDCYDALAWTFAHAEMQRIDADRIGVMGESAGGGLAAALALLARDRGEHRLAFQHLIYPMIDDRTGTVGNANPTTGEFVWTPADNRFGWAALLGRTPGSEDTSPYAAATRETNLAGLPPTFIAVGALDLFVDEDIEYARRLTRAAVPVELHVYPGAFHGFDLVPDALISNAARRDSRDALRRFLQSGQ